MESKDLMEILEELTKNKYKRSYANSLEMDAFLLEKNISNSDLMLLINALVNDDIFVWIDFISLKIVRIASDTTLFINLITSIINKVKYDLSQGNFVKALINIGENNSELGIQIYDKIIKSSREEQVILYSGLILGGVGRKQPEKIIPYLKRILFSNKNLSFDDNIKIALIKCIRVMIEKKDTLENIDFYFDVLRVVSDPTNSDGIRYEALNLSFDMFKFNKDICYNHIFKLLSTDSSNILKYQIADKLLVWGLKDVDYEFKLIKILANSDDYDTLSKIAYYLAKNNQYKREESFNIFKEWIKRDEELHIHELDYMLGEMGKINFEYYFNSVMDWIKIEDDIRIIYTISRVIDNLTNKNQNMTSRLLEFKELFSKRIRELDKSSFASQQ